MKKILLLISVIFLFVFNSLVEAQDMMKYHRDTRKMIADGQYKEALARCIWFHNHALEHDSDMRGIRLSFALSDWKKLGDKYPPALAALKEIRDKKTKQVIDNPGPENLFDEVVSINHYTESDPASIDLFLIIEKKDSVLSKSCLYWIKEELFAAKRYDILGRYLKNPMTEFDQAKRDLKRDTSMVLENQMLDFMSKATFRNGFIIKSIDLIQFSLAVKDIKSAKMIQQQALAVIDDKRLHDAIPEDKK